jgi:hypothetical protein
MNWKEKIFQSPVEGSLCPSFWNKWSDRTILVEGLDCLNNGSSVQESLVRNAESV